MTARLPHRSIAFTIVAFAAFASLARAEWQPDVKLSVGETSTELNENMGHCLIASGSSIHAIWSAAKSKNDRAIYFRRSTDNGATWSEQARISPPGVNDSFPLIAISGSTLHLTFLRNSGLADSASYYRRSTDGGQTWGDEILLGKTKWWSGLAAAGANVYVTLNTVYPDDEKNSVVYFRRSTDNGSTWSPQQPLSQAPRRTDGRSEDPAIAADGKNVHVVWNDNRDAEPRKGMSVYYRRSKDAGATWEPEVALTRAPAFTYFPNISLNGSHVDIAYGDRQASRRYDIFHLHSADFGSVWQPAEQITHTTDGELYPAIIRDGAYVHLTWIGKQGILYQCSTDAGATWQPPTVLTDKGKMPFIATTGEAVHVIFISQRDGHNAIYYKRDLAGNKAASR